MGTQDNLTAFLDKTIIIENLSLELATLKENKKYVYKIKE